MKQNKKKVLVYGGYQLGYSPLVKSIEEPNLPFNIYFEPLNTRRQFEEFDIVILHNNIFKAKDSYGRKVIYNLELLKRDKELQSFLNQKEKIVCLLYNDLTIPHTESDDRLGLSVHEITWNEITQTDLLTKYLRFFTKNIESFYNNETFLELKRGEFKNYLDKYGVTKNYFEFENKDENDLKIIANCKQEIVAFSFSNKVICLPFMIADKNSQTIKSAYMSLVNAVLSFTAKIYYEGPSWIDEFQFSEENNLLDAKKSSEQTLKQIELKLETFKGLKQALYFGDDALVGCVKNVLDELCKGTAFKIVRDEKYEEDLKVYENSDLIGIIEIKGLNNNIGRKEINDTDNHREALLIPDKFAILIANTFMKAIIKLDDKDRQIETNTITHAKANQVLITRTLDLLKILKNVWDDKISSKQMFDVFKNENGWLKATESGYEIIK